MIWRQRIWRCGDADCVNKTFVEQFPSLVAARGSITTCAVIWAIGQLRREHATIAGLARQLGTSWKTVWRAIESELIQLAARSLRDVLRQVHPNATTHRRWNRVVLGPVHGVCNRGDRGSRHRATLVRRYAASGL
ncbi:helix-turn-helix domain-containing protein [Arthrobacter sp. Soc17.1.1.1]|uniref:helix-turn-helix domain-containing protein n=1 Tax=Arthrobacter sp. Soc17.1.1.1 TaxID=3121277 RepID=UPI002FE48F94